MTDKHRIAHDKALKLAIEACTLIGDVTERIAIAGSIRRGKAQVGDIEIVCQPRFEGKVSLLAGRLNILLLKQTLAERKNKNGHRIAWGARYVAAWFEGVALDVFIVQPDRQWGPTMVIRTGPGDANAALVTEYGRVNQEFMVSGVCPAGMRFAEGAVWRGTQKLDTPEEWDVFAALGLPWLPPQMRTPNRYALFADRRPPYWIRQELAEDEPCYCCAGSHPLIDAIYLMDGDGEFEARLLQWNRGGPQPSTPEESVDQLNMFGKVVEYG